MFPHSYVSSHISISLELWWSLLICLILVGFAIHFKGSIFSKCPILIFNCSIQILIWACLILELSFMSLFKNLNIRLFGLLCVRYTCSVRVVLFLERSILVQILECGLLKNSPIEVSCWDIFLYFSIDYIFISEDFDFSVLILIKSCTVQSLRIMVPRQLKDVSPISLRSNQTSWSSLCLLINYHYSRLLTTWKIFKSYQ